jgi:broad-specificity NMP kinase
MSRTLPNLIITGTPGTGKTSHCELLAERTGLKHVSVNEVVKDRECHEGWDDEFQSWVVDEDKVRFCFVLLLPSISGSFFLSLTFISLHIYIWLVG